MALTAQLLRTLLPKTPEFPVFPSICRLRVSVGLTVSRFRKHWQILIVSGKVLLY